MQQQPQPPVAQWGPPSAGYTNQGYGNQGYNQNYNQSYNQDYGNNSVQMPQGPAPGAVPLYNARDERVPAYTGFPTAHASDEKNPFEDVKV